jgi:hypothetical protein
MTTDRDKLTTFFYLLTHRLAWGEVIDTIEDARAREPDTLWTKAGAALAREMVTMLLGPDRTEAEPVLDPGWLPYTEHERWLAANRGHIDQLREVIRLAINEHGGVSARIADAVIAAGWTRAPANADRERRAALRDAAKLLARTNTMRGPFQDEINATIDRCNLAAIADGGVVRSEPDPLTLETATGQDLDFAGALFGRVRGCRGESDCDYRDVESTGATAAEVERLRKFEDGVTEMLGDPQTGTAEMLERLRRRLTATEAKPETGESWQWPWVVEYSDPRCVFGYWDRSKAVDEEKAGERLGRSPLLRVATDAELCFMRKAAPNAIAGIPLASNRAEAKP